MIHHRALFIVCYGASGAAALVYQVVWVRIFTLALGHTVASSSIVLGAFMCGLALGAGVAGRFKWSPARALAMYAVLELLIAAVAVALPTALAALQPFLSWAYADGDLPVRFSLVRTSISFMLLGLPAAAPAAAAPTAVAAGFGDTATASPIQTIAQLLVAGGMLLLMAGAWIGLGRREFGTHEA